MTVRNAELAGFLCDALDPDRMGELRALLLVDAALWARVVAIRARIAATEEQGGGLSEEEEGYGPWRWRPDLLWCHHCGHNALVETRDGPLGVAWLCHVCGTSGLLDDADGPRAEAPAKVP